MSVVRPGLEVRFALFVAFVAILTAAIVIVRRRGKIPYIRRIAGIEALAELVGRATELSRPIFVTFGHVGRFSGGAGSEGQVGGLAILGYIAQLCAKTATRLVTVMQDEAVFPLVLQNVYEGYLAGGRPDLMRYEDHEYKPQYAYSVGVVSSMEKHNISSFVQIGQITHEGVIFSETAAKLGAIQLTGVPGVMGDLGLQLAFSSYQLIGDEVLVAGAYISKDLAQLGSIVGSDICKLLAIAVGLLILLLANSGVPLPKL